MRSSTCSTTARGGAQACAPPQPLTSISRRRRRLMRPAAAASGSSQQSEPAAAAPPAAGVRTRALSADTNYARLCSNMGSIAARDVSGYAGRWARYQGPTTNKLLAEGDIIYGFRRKPGAPGVSQVWKAEEGDLSSPKLQAQRQQLPQLQKDPLQLQLDMDTLIVEVAADTPLMEPDLSGERAKLAGHPAGLSGAMRVLAVPDWGNAVVCGGLPAIGRQQGLPEAFNTWFNRLYLREPGPDGGQRWSVMCHYCTATGAFLTHYMTYEAALSPPPDSLAHVFTPGAHAGTLAGALQARRALSLPDGGVAGLLAAHGWRLAGTAHVVRYDEQGRASASADAGEPCELHSGSLGGGPDAVEVWYGDAACYFRAPASLAPDALAGQAVVLEAGALLAPAQAGGLPGLTRWLLGYSADDAQLRRLLWARQELYR